VPYIHTGEKSFLANQIKIMYRVAYKSKIITNNRQPPYLGSLFSIKSSPLPLGQTEQIGFESQEYIT